jgi:hypothetical protein
MGAGFRGSARFGSRWRTSCTGEVCVSRLSKVSSGFVMAAQVPSAEVVHVEYAS